MRADLRPPDALALPAGGLRAVADAARTLAAQGRDAVIAVVAVTNGSTYRKSGALILLDARGVCAGALSGGCLEPQLEDCARAVLASGHAGEVRFDTSEMDDRVFGSGTGCGGAMRVLLLPLPATEAPLRSALNAACERGAWLKLVLATEPDRVGCGEARVGAHAYRFDVTGKPVEGVLTFVERVAAALAPPPRILLLGAGPEAPPLLALTRMLGWYAELVEHRARWASYIAHAGVDVLHAMGPEAVPALMAGRHYDAVLVMTHNFELDLKHLRNLAEVGVGYVGLLGPPARRDSLLAEIGDIAATRLEPRLYAPVGLRLGGEGPESIALAIVAQLQHHFSYDKVDV